MTLRVFLIEDSPVIRESLAPAMEEMAPVKIVGFADDEPSATVWIAAHSEDVDLLVIDVLLRRGSGLDVLRKASKATNVCKVVLSNYATPDVRRKCLELGAARVFDKSTDIEALIQFCACLHTGEPGRGFGEPASSEVRGVRRRRVRIAPAAFAPACSRDPACSRGTTK